MHTRRTLLAVALVLAAGAQLAAVENVTLFRVFLNDGTAVVSYGEFARVGDRVIFSIPIGAIDTAAPEIHLHVVNIPAAAVNWAATSKYADSARLAHYLATNAEADYAALTGEVAEVLNSVMFTKNPQARLNLALQARRRLASWAQDHYGYRSDDVRQVMSLLDEVISEMRVAAGQTAFSLELTASVEPAKPGPLLADPTPAESIAQALAVAKVSDASADRVSLLRAVVTAIDDRRNAAPPAWAKSTRRWAVRTIGQEASTDKVYGQFSSTILQRASEAAAHADVRGIEKIIETAERKDAEMGGRRPDVVNALLADVHAQLDAARRLRLARDQWKERVESFRAYRRAVEPIFSNMEKAQRDLEDIKKLAGSEASSLVSLGNRIEDSSRMLNGVFVPDELKPTHALLLSALSLAETAVKTRRQAVVSGELASAWDASSAAAGSMMLFARAQEDMEATVKLPEIR